MYALLHYHTQDYYNNVPDKATSYKGRALLKFRIETRRPRKYNTPDIKPFKRPIKRISYNLAPPTQDYILQALIICGIELPSFGTIVSNTLRVRVCVGINEINTRAARFENGQCRWNEFIISEKITLPADVAQIPDVFIYLVREDGKPVCFTRRSVRECGVEKGDNELRLMGFELETQWFLLQEDKSIDALGADVFPGNTCLMLVCVCIVVCGVYRGVKCVPS